MAPRSSSRDERGEVKGRATCEPRRARRRGPTGPLENARQSNQLVVLTVGHSTRTVEAFIQLIRAHGVKRIIDVRTMPRSRRNPQFNRDALSKRLHSARIHYRHLRRLGGLRHARRDSQNLGWRNASFRGFADYMLTAEFERGLEELMRLAKQERAAVMCAEAVPWRCHRSLIADALLARNIRVEHIMTPKQRNPHRLTAFACVAGERLTYPPSGSLSGEAQR